MVKNNGKGSDPADGLYVELGRRIRLARKTTGITQIALGERVCVARTSITKIERGQQRILVHTLYEIAAAIGVPISELLPATMPSREEKMKMLLEAITDEPFKAYVQDVIAGSENRL